MKKLLLFVFTGILSFQVQAQTKRIAHRSHSGKNSTLLLTTDDNFGLPHGKKADSTQKPAPATTLKKKTKKKAIGRKKAATQ